MKKTALLLCLCFNYAFASTPITHAYLAKIWIEQSNTKTEEEQILDKDFLLGSVYPDIRYVAAISREKTHKKNVTKDDIKSAKTRFLSGCKLHSFIDEQREQFVTDSKIYSWLEEECKDNPLLHFAFISNKYALLCILEDEIIRKKYSFEELVEHFNKIHTEEINDGITGKNVEAWHNFLKAYFKGTVTKEDEISPQLMPILLIRGLVGELTNQEKIIQYTDGMIDFFKNLF
jgi:hypothetical protein